MKVLKTLTPESIAPEPFQARCAACPWTSLRTKFAESAETLAEDHVRTTSHRVDIVEDDQ